MFIKYYENAFQRNFGFIIKKKQCQSINNCKNKKKAQFIDKLFDTSG